MRPKQELSETTVRGKTAEVQGCEGIVGGMVYAGGPVISLNEAWCRHSSRGMGWRSSHTTLCWPPANSSSSRGSGSSSSPYIL